MAKYLVVNRGSDPTEISEHEAKSYKEVAEKLAVGVYSIYTITSRQSVHVKEVTTKAVVLGNESWDTTEEE